MIDQMLGSLPPILWPRWNFWLLASAWYSPGCFGRLGGKWASKWNKPFSVYLSLSNKVKIKSSACCIMCGTSPHQQAINQLYSGLQLGILYFNLVLTLSAGGESDPTGWGLRPKTASISGAFVSPALRASDCPATYWSSHSPLLGSISLLE